MSYLYLVLRGWGHSWVKWYRLSDEDELSVQGKKPEILSDTCSRKHTVHRSQRPWQLSHRNAANSQNAFMDVRSNPLCNIIQPLSLFPLCLSPSICYRNKVKYRKWKQLLNLLVCACYSMLLKPKDTVGHWCITCKCLLETLPLCYTECCECVFIHLCVFTRVFSNCNTLSSQGHRSEWRL